MKQLSLLLTLATITAHAADQNTQPKPTVVHMGRQENNIFMTYKTFQIFNFQPLYAGYTKDSQDFFDRDLKRLQMLFTLQTGITKGEMVPTKNHGYCFVLEN
jgi:hypothetical protein